MKVIFTILNLFLLAGAILLLVFTVLTGSTNHFPLNRFYWLKADTSNIDGAFDSSSWTFWGVCESSDFSNCMLGPAYPISPVDNFHTTSGVPQKFIDDRDLYYFLTRFAFAFIIITLCFVGLAFVIDILGFCFLIVDKFVICLVSLALFFMAGAASMQTAAIVLARNAFSDSGVSANVGTKSMAILWATFGCILFVWINTFSSNIVNSIHKHLANVNAEKQEYEPRASTSIVGGPVGDESSFTRTAPEVKDEESNGGGIRFFKIKRNQKTSDEESV